MRFYTSDLHLWHNNIIAFADRPFDDVEEMNRTLIKNINKTVGQKDTLYILGDIAFGMRKEDTIESFLNQVWCHDVHLIFGNHDKHDETMMRTLGFRSATDYEMVHVSKKNKLVMSHYPMMSWDGSCHGAYMLHGHIHSQGSTYNEQNRANGIRRYDVGVDANDYKPVSEEEIVQFFTQSPETNGSKKMHGELDFLS